MESFTLVLFGATGDLAKIKILPAVYQLCERGLLPEHFTLVGVGRSEHSQDEFRDYVRRILTQKLGDKEMNESQTKACSMLLSKTHYCQGDVNDDEFYPKFRDYLDQMLEKGIDCGNRVFHLAILPNLYQKTIEQLGKAGLAKTECGWSRVMIEKPFGSNATSAKKLDETIHQFFDETQVFRLDHYLAKETVENILAFRFGNGLFEPIWNHRFIDHIQIQLLEDFGVEQRGRFYDATGALSDVAQNHLLELVAVTMMGRPVDLSVGEIRSKRLEVLESIKRYSPEEVASHVVRAQYDQFSSIPDVKPDSKTETYVALKLIIERERWQGVPVYIRTGKNLKHTASEVSIVFKQPPFTTFPSQRHHKQPPNVLTIRISPNEGIVLRMAVKKPGPKLALKEADLEFCYGDIPERLMKPYAKLLFDAFAGDQMLATTAASVQAQWKFADPIITAWHQDSTQLFNYPKGSWGPEAADELLARDGKKWLEPNLEVC